MIRSVILFGLYLFFILYAPPSFSNVERAKLSPLKTSWKALRTIHEVRSIKKKFKNKIENKVKNAVGNAWSEAVTKRISGAAVMLITKEVKVRYKDFRLIFDSDELILSYGKGF